MGAICWGQRQRNGKGKKRIDTRRVRWRISKYQRTLGMQKK